MNTYEGRHLDLPVAHMYLRNYTHPDFIWVMYVLLLPTYLGVSTSPVTRISRKITYYTEERNAHTSSFRH